MIRSENGKNLETKLHWMFFKNLRRTMVVSSWKFVILPFHKAHIGDWCCSWYTWYLLSRMVAVLEIIFIEKKTHLFASEKNLNEVCASKIVWLGNFESSFETFLWKYCNRNVETILPLKQTHDSLLSKPMIKNFYMEVLSSNSFVEVTSSS